MQKFRGSWPIWFVTCVAVSINGCVIYFQRDYFEPDFTFPLPHFLSFHDPWVPLAYFAFTFVAFAIAALFELFTMQNYSQYRSENKWLLVSAVVVVLALTYTRAPIDSALMRILTSPATNDKKLAQLKP